MGKIIKAWVSKKTRADGKVYYTAHVIERNWFLRMIPINHTRDVVRMVWNQGRDDCYYTYELFYRNSFNEAFKFKTRLGAEAELMDAIEREINQQNLQRDRIVVKEEDFPISDI